MSALTELAELLRSEETVISDAAAEPEGEATLGELAAAGPRSSAEAAEYALLFEAIREGYLLHYGEPRIVRGAEPDLALLAGDYLYAMGLERLAGLGDLEAIVELGDLISLSAFIHDGGHNGGHDGVDDDARAQTLADALWLAAAAAVAVGRSDAHEDAKRMVRERDPGSADALWNGAVEAAAASSIQAALEAARDAIGFAGRNLS
jgi:hypothetical protein